VAGEVFANLALEADFLVQAHGVTLSRKAAGVKIGTLFQGCKTSKSASLLISASAAHACNNARN
jgi:hypothetical protein